MGIKGPATNPTASWTFQLPATEPASAGVVMAGSASSHASGLTVEPAPAISAANMTNFPTLNQNSTGYSAAVAGGGANQVLIQTGSNTTGFCSIFVDGSTAISPTAASLNCGPTITNYGQAASNISITLPTPTATGQGFIASVGTAQASNYWRFTAGTAGTMYLDGGATGKDYMQFTAPAVGNYFVCFAQQTGSSTWRWNCKTGAGTVATN